MKEVRVHLSEQDYGILKAEADNLGITVRQLIQNRAVGVASKDILLLEARLLCTEIARCREAVNQIVALETHREVGLYEDDIIRIESSMHEIEKMVVGFVRTRLREAKQDG